MNVYPMRTLFPRFRLCAKPNGPSQIRKRERFYSRVLNSKQNCTRARHVSAAKPLIKHLCECIYFCHIGEVCFFVAAVVTRCRKLRTIVTCADDFDVDDDTIIRARTRASCPSDACTLCTYKNHSAKVFVSQSHKLSTM